MPRKFLPALRGMETKSLLTFGTSRAYTPSSVQTYGRRDRSAGWDMDTVIDEGYERVVWVYKAVEVISGNASRLPFKITDGDSDLESHPLLRVMNKRANPLETGRMFRKRLSAQILLSKRGAFVEVTKNNAGQVTRLDLLPPDRVRIVPDFSGDYISYYEYTRWDGVMRPIPPERIRWIREPHPMDPYSGTTPLDAAGMSVDLDYLARAYNVSFINRDGRPGGILGVDADGLEQGELDRITQRLKPGPHFAGQITAIGTGPGGINYIDTSARPRDMAYGETSSQAKKEILAAFGVPESKAGDSSGRTFDNAEQEEYNFWQDPMRPHLDLIAAAFDEDVDPDLDCGFDTTGVEALELPDRRRRTERREEWNAGLITIKEYRADVSDLDVIDNPHTRALWISPSKAPVPFDDLDAVALGMGDASGGGAAAGVVPAAPVAVTADQVVSQALAEGAVLDPAAAVEQVSGAAAQAVDAARDASNDPVVEGAAAAAINQARMETKSLPTGDTASYDPGEDDTRRVEMAVSAALDALLARQVSVIVARLEAPKTRKGTRYWSPDASGSTDHVGDGPIDAEKVVDPARWAAETRDALAPIIGPAGRESAQGMLEQMNRTGSLVGETQPVAPVSGREPAEPAPDAAAVESAAGVAAVGAVLLASTVAEQAMLSWLGERVADINALMVDTAGGIDLVVDGVKKLWDAKSRPFAKSLGSTISQTVVLGPRENVLTRLDVGNDTGGVVRVWVTRHDERVRETHQEADGQVRPLGHPFLVGGYELPFPSYPLAPPSVVRGCRCWLRYEWPAGAKYQLGAS